MPVHRSAIAAQLGELVEPHTTGPTDMAGCSARLLEQVELALGQKPT